MRSHEPCLFVPQQPHSHPLSSEGVLQLLTFSLLERDQDNAACVVAQANSTPSSVMKSRGVT